MSGCAHFLKNVALLIVYDFPISKEQHCKHV